MLKNKTRPSHGIGKGLESGLQYIKDRFTSRPLEKEVKLLLHMEKVLYLNISET